MNWLGIWRPCPPGSILWRSSSRVTVRQQSQHHRKAFFKYLPTSFFRPLPSPSLYHPDTAGGAQKASGTPGESTSQSSQGTGSVDLHGLQGTPSTVSDGSFRILSGHQEMPFPHSTLAHDLPVSPQALFLISPHPLDSSSRSVSGSVYISVNRASLGFPLSIETEWRSMVRVPEVSRHHYPPKILLRWVGLPNKVWERDGASLGDDSDCSESEDPLERRQSDIETYIVVLGTARRENSATSECRGRRELGGVEESSSSPFCFIVCMIIWQSLLRHLTFCLQRVMTSLICIVDNGEKIGHVSKQLE